MTQKGDPYTKLSTLYLK